ncbi:hypothetical protein VMCG_10949 [Cytospora schulzeri]|uniref:Protein kinase domain-containing protein n=1 Tax=Cytospora schulzeri TaxID=448051 RepID=A0A423V7L3_9PEZI|nr:hypothetical protein VMCG_10949 [Valsa malicola]
MSLAPEELALLERTSDYLDSLVHRVQQRLRKIERKGRLHATINMSLWIARRSELNDLERELYEWTERLNVRILSLPKELRAAIPRAHDGVANAQSSAVLRNGDRLRNVFDLSSNAKISRAKALLLKDPKELISEIEAIGDISSLPFKDKDRDQQIVFSGRTVSANVLPGTTDFETLSSEMGELAAALNSLDATTDLRLLKVEYYLYYPPSKQFLFAHIPPCRVDSMMTLQKLITHDSFPETETALDKCFKVAYKLAEAIFFLHTAGFLHKNISSSSVVIFRRFEPPHSGAASPGTIDEAYLMGFDLIRGIEAKTYKEGASRGDSQESTTTWTFDIYQHPDRLRGQISQRYSRTYDVYSLGVLLLELGLWKPLFTVLGQLDKGDPSSWTNELSRNVPNLGPRVGGKYQRIVEWCLSLSGDQGVREIDFTQEVLDPLEDMMNVLV